MADDVEVKLGADVAPASAAFDSAASSIADSLNKVADALGKLQNKSKETGSQIESNNASIGRSFVVLKETINGNVEGAIGVIERFKGAIAAASTVIAGGFLWGEVISQLREFTDGVLTLENVLGMTSDKATEMAVALKIAGSSAEEFAGISLRLARQLRSNEEGFQRNGVQVRNTAGAFLPLDQVMQNAFTRMGQLRAGADQAEFALTFFGRSVQDVYKLMIELPEAQIRAAQLMQDLGIEFGPDRQNAVRAYGTELNVFKEMLSLAAVEIGIKVLPQLQGLAAWFVSVGPTVIGAFLSSVSGLLITIDLAKTGFQEWGVKIAEWGNVLVSVTSSAMQSFKAVIAGNFTEALDIWERGEKERVRIHMEANAAILGLEVDHQKRIALIAGDGKKAGPGKGPMPTGTDTFKPNVPAGGEDSSASWDTLLKEAQSAYNNLRLEQGSFETWSVGMTRDYWAEVLAMDGLSFKERQSALNHFYDAERQVQQEAFAAEIAGLEAQKANYKYNADARIAIAQQEYDLIAQRYGALSAQAQLAQKKITEEVQRGADQRVRIAEIEAKAVEATANFEYNQAKTNAQQQLALRQVSVQQELVLEQQYLDRKLAIDLAANAAAAAAAWDNPEKLATLNAQKLSIEQQYQAEKTRIANQAELDRKQFALQAAQDVQDTFANFISDTVSGAKKLKDAMHDALQTIANDLIKLGSQQLAKQLLGPGTAGGGVVSGFMDKLFGAGALNGGAAIGGAGADTAHTAATTADTAAITTNTTALTAQLAENEALQGASLTLEIALGNVATAGASAAAALQAVAASGGLGGLGGLGGDTGSIFDATGGAFGIPGFAEGTPYVPRDTLAMVHRGEAIVPARFNTSSATSNNSNLRSNMTNNFYGSQDTRSTRQIENAQVKAFRRAVRR